MSLYEMRNTVAGRVTGALAAFALVVGLSFGGAVAAQADDTSDLQAEIDRLLTLIEQLQSQLGGTTVTPPAGDFTYTFTRNLTIGATGEDVRMLQRYLNRNAATQVAPAGVAGGSGAETSYYGPATAAAVKKYQELHAADILHPLGLTVGTPNFGASTRAFMNKEIAAGGSTTPGTPGTPGTPSGDLKGGEADLSLNVVAETDVTADSRGQHAFTIEVEADRRGGDARIDRMDLQLVARESGSVVRSYRAISAVELRADGKKLASLNTDRRGDWRGTDNDFLRFTGLDLVVRSGDTVEIEVLLDLTDRVDSVTLDEVEYRYADAAGLVLIENESGIGAVASAGDVEELSLRFTKNSNTPGNTTLDVSRVRSNETLVVSDVEVRGGEYGVIEGAQVEVDFTGSANLSDVRALVSQFALRLGNRTFTVNANSSDVTYSGTVATVVFDTDDFDIEEGDRFKAEVQADFRKYTTGPITSVQVTEISFAGYDEAADAFFDFNEAAPSPYTSFTKDVTSYAAKFTVSQGDVEVDVISVDVADATIGTSPWDVEITLQLTNNTGGVLNTALGDFSFTDSTGITGVTLDSVSGAGSIADGDTEEFDFVLKFTGRSSTNPKFSTVLSTVDSVPVGYTIRENN